MDIHNRPQGYRFLGSHFLRDHVLLGLVVSVSFLPVWPATHCLVFWLSSTLVDSDHYLSLFYFSGFKLHSPMKALNFYSYLFDHGPNRKFLTLELFHTMEFVALIFFLAFGLNLAIFRPISLGISFHIAVDFIFLSRIHSLRTRCHSLIEFAVRKKAMNRNGIDPLAILREAGRSIGGV